MPADPTQPAPGPTREQEADLRTWVSELLAEEVGLSDFSHAEIIAGLRMALLPARTSPTDDDLSTENAKLWADLTRAISERNAVAEAAAAYIHPGPDHEDERIRQELIAEWMDRGRDDAESWRQSWEKAARERDAALAEIKRLRQALADRQIVLDQNHAYWAEIERLRAHQGTT